MTSPIWESFKDLENLKFDPFESREVLLDDSNDPEQNFFNKIPAADT